MRDRKFKISKNKIMTLVLIVLFVVCCVMNSKFVGTDNAKILGEAEYVNSSSNYEEDAFFENRLEIEKGRDSEISHLKSVMESDLADKEAKEEAKNVFLELVSNIEKEKICQEQIKLKIKFDNLVILNNGQATVNVKTENLLPVDVAKIQEIVHTHTGIALNCIKIQVTN